MRKKILLRISNLIKFFQRNLFSSMAAKSKAKDTSTNTTPSSTFTAKKQKFVKNTAKIVKSLDRKEQKTKVILIFINFVFGGQKVFRVKFFTILKFFSDSKAK